MRKFAITLAVISGALLVVACHPPKATPEATETTTSGAADNMAVESTTMTNAVTPAMGNDSASGTEADTGMNNETVASGNAQGGRTSNGGPDVRPH
jgi:hypothetical protein